MNRSRFTCFTVPPLKFLKTGLDSAYWDPAQRGPLIAVAPEAVRPAWQTAVRQTLLGPDGNYLPVKPPTAPEMMPGGQYRVTDLADYFGRRIIRLKGLSVLAPTEMAVLNTKRENRTISRTSPARRKHVCCRHR